MKPNNQSQNIIPGDAIVNCMECDWSGKYEDCPLEWESEEWEYPEEYQVLICPECGGYVEM